MRNYSMQVVHLIYSELTWKEITMRLLRSNPSIVGLKEPEGCQWRES